MDEEIESAHGPKMTALIGGIISVSLLRHIDSRDSREIRCHLEVQHHTLRHLLHDPTASNVALTDPVQSPEVLGDQSSNPP